MMLNRPIIETPGSLFFDEKLPIFINRAPENFELQEHTHEFVEICLIAEGEGEHYIDGTHFKVTKGDLFFIPLGVSHVFRPRSADHRLIVYNCIFKPAVLQELLALFALEEEMQAFYHKLEEDCRWLEFRDNGGEVHRLLQRLHQQHEERTPGYSAGLYAGLIELLVTLYRLSLGMGVSGADAAPAGGVLGLLEEIKRAPAAPVAAEEAAKRLGVSSRQLQRLVRQAAGMSLTDYVQDARIQESCRLLSSTSEKISTIAGAVGYQDIKFFNRLFKRKTGLTPRDYRAKSGTKINQ